MLRSRKEPLITTRAGCTSLLRVVVEGANSSEFSKQKAALTALGTLRENECTSALMYIMNDFSSSEDSFKQYLGKKARDYLKLQQHVRT